MRLCQFHLKLITITNNDSAKQTRYTLVTHMFSVNTLARYTLVTHMFSVVDILCIFASYSALPLLSSRFGSSTYHCHCEILLDSRLVFLQMSFD